MRTSCRWVSNVLLTSALAIAGSASATPVVYTLRTVADGKLGSYVFSEALVTIQMKADTRTVQKQASSNAGFLYTNSIGTATIRIADASGRTVVATFAQGQVYVRYDSGTGIAGFGSSISPTYPVALDCDDYAYPDEATYLASKKDCSQGDWLSNPSDDNGTLSALAHNPSGYSRELLNLPQNLSQSTLLTGRAHSCATNYTIGPNYDDDGDLYVCSGPAPLPGLSTDHGGFFLQDQQGGSNNWYYNGNDWGGWHQSNVGYLQVEVMSEDD
jgi:hypothetical protein